MVRYSGIHIGAYVWNCVQALILSDKHCISCFTTLNPFSAYPSDQCVMMWLSMVRVVVARNVYVEA